MTFALLQDALATKPAVSRDGMLDRLFAWWFGRFVYNQIWEDPRVDLAALELKPDSKVVTIASGGCNMMAYLAAGPADVTAVDLNPCHVHLARLKLAAAKHLPGHDDFFAFFGHGSDPRNVERYLQHLRWRLPDDTRKYWDSGRITWFANGFYKRSLLGRFLGVLHVSGKLLGHDPRRMLEATSLEEQRRLFEEHVSPAFDRLPVRLAGKMPFILYSLGIPRSQGDALRRAANDDLAELCRERVRRLACDFPLSDNYFAWQAFGRRYDEAREAVPDYLRPEAYLNLRANAGRGRVRLATVTEHLSEQPDGSVDAVVLLDAQDWMNAEQLTSLWNQIGRACRPGARIIFRTAVDESPLPGQVPAELLARFDYHAERSKELASQDRSAIYGGFHLYTLER